MSVIADLHLHSKYSRAVSPQMEIPEMSRQAQRRGIHLLATGDWTHPAWFGHLQRELEEWQSGIYFSRKVGSRTKFLLSTEISCIFSQSGKVRRIHLLVFSPSLEVCEKINTELRRRGAKLESDGRPILGMSCIELCEVVFGVDPTCMIIPAHAWTPWFGIYGSRGGFNSLKEAFGKYVDQIVAIETGLSSDPEMNWKISELNNRAIVSFSDAHSPNKMSREATVFVGNTKSFSIEDDLQLKNVEQMKYTYEDIRIALSEPFTQQNVGELKLGYTIEYYPEEGKYHWDGHRACKYVQSPAETRKRGIICPVCGKPLTIGVEYRVDELADTENPTQIHQRKNDLKYYSAPGRLPFFKLVPLQEVVAKVEHKAVNTKTVLKAYDTLLTLCGTEFEILLETSLERITEVAGQKMAEAISQIRKGELHIEPGFDGEYGIVTLNKTAPAETTDQLDLF
jgi:uncharacterized protein (TIGR00375 family)